MKTATILGAGISGLTCAWHLQRAGWKVIVLEAGDRTGGAIKSHREGDYLAEAGPNTLMLNDGRIRKWISDLGLDEDLVVANPESRKRFLALDGDFHPVPMSPVSLWKTSLLTGRGKRRLLAEPFIRAPHPYPDEESLADFVRRRLGTEVLDRMVQPVVSGIFAGDPERLSVAGAFPMLRDMEQETGSLLRGMLKRKKSPHAIPRQLISFRRGLQSLPDAMAKDLGASVRTGCQVSSMAPDGEGGWTVNYRQGEMEKVSQGKLVCAVPAHVLSRLPWSGKLPEELSCLDEIAHPPLVSVTYAFKRKDVPHPLDGFGGLIPATEGQPVLGILFISTLFPGRCPEDEVLLTMFLGGRLRPDEASGSEAEMLEKCAGVLDRYLGIKKAAVFTSIHPWDRSIPQPEIGHRFRLQVLDRIEAGHTGLYFLGNYRGGVSLGQCLVSAGELAKNMNTGTAHPL